MRQRGRQTWIGQRWSVIARFPATVLLLLGVTVVLWGTVGRTIPALASLHDALGLNDGPLYSVGNLRDELALQPGAWLGRTVWLYAVATHVRVQYCPYPLDACVGEMPVFAAPGSAPTPSLPLVWGLSDPTRARLRQVRLLASIVPPQAPHWGRPATYRVVLRRLPGPRCRRCYAAVLLDASPVAGL
jgi:hypothetical protein